MPWITYVLLIEYFFFYLPLPHLSGVPPFHLLLNCILGLHDYILTFKSNFCSGILHDPMIEQKFELKKLPGFYNEN